MVGIAALPYGRTIINCYNKGIIKNNYDGGGAGGIAYGGEKFLNCYNFNSITGQGLTAGIVCAPADSINYCFNSGRIKSTYSGCPAGGIVASSSKSITNCHNTGDVEGLLPQITGEILGTGNDVGSTNDYLLKYDENENNINVNSRGAIGKNKAEMDEIMSVQNFVNLMNAYVAENNEDSTKVKLKTWKVENGFPVFAE